MVNPTGKNGHPEQTPPDDDTLKAALLKYARAKMTREQQITALQKDFGYSIRLNTLRNVKDRLGIKASVRTQKLSRDAVTKAVVDVVEKDPAQSHGPDFVQDQLRLKMLFAPRDLIRDVMIERYPDGFDVRFPGKKNRRVIRVPLRASGPFYEVSGDGHEKLSPSALRMGGVGFSIYGYKDKYSDSVLFLRVYPDVRSAGAGGHIFLDFVEETGCAGIFLILSGLLSQVFGTDVPIQMTTDKGSEVGWMYAFMAALREVYAPDIDPSLYPFHVLIKSIHNTIIEGFWRHLKDKLGLNLKDFLLRGKTQHLYNPHNPLHEPLFYWIFAPLIQEELDEFADWWNHHRVRHQHEKIMPSGHVPAHALEYPDLFGALDCRIRVPAEAVEELRAQITAEEGPKSQFQAWPGLTGDFNVRASRIFFELATEKLRFQILKACPRAATTLVIPPHFSLPLSSPTTGSLPTPGEYATPASTADPPAGTNLRAQAHVVAKCPVCEHTDPPEWRTGPVSNMRVCNACAKYEQRTGTQRPRKIEHDRRARTQAGAKR
uniref:GATA-type domain-containing protein n=1 Tax=Mycena chlorophos TaxID=658473 RepID=A0ABQ0LAV2_MYCCL|nr:predicted protein [Mycena chlorophos]